MPTSHLTKVDSALAPPSTESVMLAIEASGGETVVANGAAEANALGLTTQVPTREVFFPV